MFEIRADQATAPFRVAGDSKVNLVGWERKISLEVDARLGQALIQSILRWFNPLKEMITLILVLSYSGPNKLVGLVFSLTSAEILREIAILRQHDRESMQGLVKEWLIRIKGNDPNPNLGQI